MATLSIPDQNQTLTDPAEIAAYLAPFGLGYAQWFPAITLADNATSEEILAAYASDLEPLMKKGGYKTADVVILNPETPNLDTLLNKFNKEHYHDEDEVRFTLEGNGLFHINPENAPVMAIEVGVGDLLVVPKGTRHWFNLCGDRTIKAIRLFQDPKGWTPEYTNSRVEEQYQPLLSPYGL